MKRLYNNTVGKLFWFSYLLLTFRDLLDRFSRYRPTPHGFMLAGNKNMANGHFEPAETEILKKIIRVAKPEIFINVGANVGYYVLHALRHKLYVIAIEPNARNFHYLLGNVNKNFPNVDIELYPVAAGLRNQVGQMWGGWTGASLISGWANNPSSQFNNVPIVKISNIIKNRFDNDRMLFVIDVEGFEYNVVLDILENSTSLNRMVWMIEICYKLNYPDGLSNTKYIETFELFFSKGYGCIGVISGMDYKLEDIKRIVNNCETETEHNFIFAAEDLVADIISDHK